MANWEKIGHIKRRNSSSGAILRGGQLVKTWVNVDYADMTFSISKSYLWFCMGIAVKDGIIPHIHAPVRYIVKDGSSDSEQLTSLFWAHLLQLTSKREGIIWDKPDWIDCYRNVKRYARNLEKKGSKRVLPEAGTYWRHADLGMAWLRKFLGRCERDKKYNPYPVVPIWVGSLDKHFRLCTLWSINAKKRSMERYRYTSKNMDCRLYYALFYCGIFGD